MQQPRPDAFVVTVVKEPPKEFTVGDLIVGSLGIAGTLLVLALLLGVLAGGVLVVWNRWHPPEKNHPPPVSPTLN